MDHVGLVKYFSEMESLVVQYLYKNEATFSIKRNLMKVTNNVTFLPESEVPTVEDCYNDYFCNEYKIKSWYQYINVMHYFIKPYPPGLGTYLKQEGIDLLLKPFTWPSIQRVQKASALDWATIK